MDDSCTASENGNCFGEYSGHSSGRQRRFSMETVILVTVKEEEYRKKLFPDPARVLKEKLRCTACSKPLLKHVMKGQGLYFHPILKVLVCEDCRDFYGDGDFPVDDDNSDTYCRWCAQGGSLYCCSACSFVFCKPCIRRNFKHSMLDEIEEEDWKCFVCNPEALWKHRAICWAARQYAENIPKRSDNEAETEEESEKETRRRGRSRKKLDKPAVERNRSPRKRSPRKHSPRKNSPRKSSPRRSKVKNRNKSPVEDDVGEEVKPRDEIKALREVFTSMEEITEVAQHNFSKYAKSMKLLKEWISRKNSSLKKEAPSSEEKTRKMVESCKKILVSLTEKTAKWLEDIAVMEQKWKGECKKEVENNDYKAEDAEESSAEKKDSPENIRVDSPEMENQEESAEIDADEEEGCSSNRKVLTEEIDISASKGNKTTSTANVSFDLFDDCQDSPIAIPMPQFDSDDENENTVGVNKDDDDDFTLRLDPEKNSEKDSDKERESDVDIKLPEFSSRAESKGMLKEKDNEGIVTPDAEESNEESVNSDTEENNEGIVVSEKEEKCSDSVEGRVDEVGGNNPSPKSAETIDSKNRKENDSFDGVHENADEESELAVKKQKGKKKGGEEDTEGTTQSASDVEESDSDLKKTLKRSEIKGKENGEETCQEEDSKVSSQSVSDVDESDSDVKKSSKANGIKVKDESEVLSVSDEEEKDTDLKKNDPVDKVKEEGDKDYESDQENKKIRPSKADCDAKLQFLLDSCSSDEEESKKRRLRKRQNLKDSSESYDSESSDSSVERKRTVSKKMKPSIVSSLISNFDDDKIKSGCAVLLERLKESELQDIPAAQKASSADKKDDLEKELKSLSDMRSLKKKSKICTETEDEDGDESEVEKKKKSKVQSNGNPTRRSKKAKTSGSFSSSEGETPSEEEIDSNKEKPIQPEETKIMDALAKKLLVDSLSSDIDVSDKEEDEVKKKKVDKKEKSSSEDEKKKKQKKKVVEDGDEEEGNEGDKKKNGKVGEGESSSEEDIRVSKRRHKDDKLLRQKLSETDSSEEEKKWRMKKDRLQKLSDSEEEAESKKVKSSKKRLRRVSSSGSEVFNVSSSDSSDTSDFEDKPSKRKREAKSSSSDDKTKKTKKRRRIKTLKDSSSDEVQEVKSDDEDEDEKAELANKGRKNIRKVLKGNRLGEETMAAKKEEEERRKRIAERQKLYNVMFTDQRNLETLEKLVLDFDPDTKEELVSVDPDLVKKLKPHQAEGVKFMWDACFESLKRMEKEKGSGCILAHCMGLGKTLQVIALVHTLLNNENTKIKTVLVICPLNTVLNWVNEFNIWLKDLGTGEDIEVFELTKFKGNAERMYQLKEWQRVGGVLVIGYDMFRLLATPGRKARKKIQETFTATLVDPGPDLVVCDEGHLLKNIQSALSKAVNGIKTARRIVLTGTPLQNNLKEYHCMIQFVKPSLLGTHKEFLNRFVNPISNGQCADSTPHDVRVMKRRAHVLHKMLEGCVQRCDYSVLTPFLPPKHEYVVLIRLTELQSKLYSYYLDNMSQKVNVGGARLFNDFQNLQRIWTHPRVLKMSAEKEEKRKLLQSDSEGSLKDFIVNDDDESDTTESSSNSNEVQPKKRKKMKRSCKANESSSESSDVICLTDNDNAKKSKDGNDEDGSSDVPQQQKQWWEEFVQPEDHDIMMYSGKLILLMDILQKCELIGDKVLVFSQSLYALDLIEHFLTQVDEKTQNTTLEESSFTENTPLSQGEKPPLNFLGSWAKGLDYFRIDGSVSGENRSIWCKQFNKESNIRARLFLISTRAGGMGINLVGANRVILFDASWNPSSDLQSIFRIYRFGQKKPCYVYRFLAQGTMEEKIYNRQVTKLSLASRVLDEHQIERHFNFEDLQELYRYDPNEKSKRATPMLPKDRMLAELIQKYPDIIDNYHEHDSLLENKAEEELTEEERKAAWEEFENEKKLPEIMNNAVPGMMMDPMYMDTMNEAIMPGVLETILKQNPNSTPEQLRYQLRLATGRLSQYFNQMDPHQQMIHQMTQQNSQLYQRYPPQVPLQNALMQAHYGLQNHYHSPVLPSTSNLNQQMMMMNQNANTMNPYLPRMDNRIQRPVLPKGNDMLQTIVPPPNAAPRSTQDGAAKLKIRQDLMPSQDDDIIIE